MGYFLYKDLADGDCMYACKISFANILFLALNTNLPSNDNTSFVLSPNETFLKP